VASRGLSTYYTVNLLRHSTNDSGVLLACAALSPRPNCQDHAAWCDELFPGQCYDQNTQQVCCATCSRYDKSQPGESLGGPSHCFTIAVRPSVCPYCPLRTLVTTFVPKFAYIFGKKHALLDNIMFRRAYICR